MKTVLIESPTDGLENIFTKERGFVPIIANYSDLPEGDPDLIVFSGGADVDPKLYGEQPHPKTHWNEQRDKNSLLLFHTYKHVPKIGVCRGAQFLCVMYGGKLHQHITGHSYGVHPVLENLYDAAAYVLGDHHQSCIWPDNSVFICDAPDGTVEAFYIPEGNALCVQFHPEWGHKPTEDYFFELYDRYMKEIV